MSIIPRILLIILAIMFVVIGLLSAITPIICAWGFTMCLHFWRYFDAD